MFMLETYSPQISIDSADNWSLNDLTETNDFPFLSAPTDLSIYAEISALPVSPPEATTDEKLPYKKTYIGTANGTLDLYLDQIGQYSLLSFSDELRLFKQIDSYFEQIDDHRKSCEKDLDLSDLFCSLISPLQKRIDQIKEQIISSNLRLAVYIAKRYQDRGLDLPDLIQEANLGLIKAVDKFDWRRGVRFSAYASWWIQQAIGLGVAKMGRTVRLPVHVIRDLQKINKTKKTLEQKGYSSPTATEISQEVDFPLEKIKFLLRSNMAMVSLDEDISNSQRVVSWEDRLPDESIEDPIRKLQIENLTYHLSLALQTLTERDRSIIKLRYGLNNNPVHSLQEIGSKFNISRERVRQIEKRAIKKLSEYHTLQSD